MKDLLWGLGFVGAVFAILFTALWSTNRTIEKERATHLKEISQKIEETDGTAKVVRTGDTKSYSYVVVEFKSGERLKLEGYPELAVGDSCKVKSELDGISVKRIRNE